MQVVVQAHDRTGLAVGSVALDHLPPTRNPLPTVGLHEDAPVVAVDVGLDHEHTVDVGQGGYFRH